MLKLASVGLHGHLTAQKCTRRRTSRRYSLADRVDRSLQKIGLVAFGLGPYAPADQHGTMHWSHTFNLDSGAMWAIIPLVQHVVVFHGMTLQGVYDKVLPVACGLIAPRSGRMLGKLLPQPLRGGSETAWEHVKNRRRQD